MKASFFLLAFALLPLFNVATSEAKNSSRLEIKVLPEDCLFEIVDDGTNKIIYLTPEECGLEITEPTPDQTSSPYYTGPRFQVPGAEKTDLERTEKTDDEAPASFSERLQDFVQETADIALGSILVLTGIVLLLLRFFPGSRKYFTGVLNRRREN